MSDLQNAPGGEKHPDAEHPVGTKLGGGSSGSFAGVPIEKGMPRARNALVSNGERVTLP